MKRKIQLKTRYWGPFRQDWYSICSKHQSYAENCYLCEVGQWRNRWGRKFGNLVYQISPRLWRWWANRKSSKSRKFFEKTFPNLKENNVNHRK